MTEAWRGEGGCHSRFSAIPEEFEFHIVIRGEASGTISINTVESHTLREAPSTGKGTNFNRQPGTIRLVLLDYL
jgi:hypothetical protein